MDRDEGIRQAGEWLRALAKHYHRGCHPTRLIDHLLKLGAPAESIIDECKQRGWISVAQGDGDIFFKIHADRIPANVDVGRTPTDDFLFRRCGNVWKIRFSGGSKFILLPSKGAAYLSILLANRGITLSAVDLALRIARQPADFALGTAGDAIDEAALKAYHSRLKELRADFDDAKNDQDLARQEAAEEEIKAITAELRRSKGLGKRVRQASDDRERIRKAVGNAVRRTIKEIARYDSSFAEHLKSPTLRLGHNPLYYPKDDIDWVTEI